MVRWSLLAGFLLLVACAPDAPPEPEVAVASTPQVFSLSAEELKELERLANAGDGEAAGRIADYYSLSVGDDAAAIPWLTISAEQGVVGAMNSLTHSLARAGGDENCKLALLWQERASKAASGKPWRDISMEEVAHLPASHLSGCINYRPAPLSR